MTTIAQALAKVLLQHHAKFCYPRGKRSAAEVTDQDVEASVISYGEICDQAHPSCAPRGVGRFLCEVSEWCKAHGWPPISALAVLKRTRFPGGNYPGKDWKKEVRECIAFKDYPTTP
jgi:hypothetical protein